MQNITEENKSDNKNTLFNMHTRNGVGFPVRKILPYHGTNLRNKVEYSRNINRIDIISFTTTFNHYHQKKNPLAG